MRVLQLCGTHPSVFDAPEIEGADRWILGAGYAKQGAGLWTRVFDVHDWDGHVLVKRPEAARWYAQQTKPIYLREHRPEVPASVSYPRHALVREFGVRGACALSSSMDQMMALAILERQWDVIRLEGAPMVTPEEWVTQRECLAYWIGQAEARGIEVITDPRAAFCAPEVLYGFGEPTGARRAPGTPDLVLR